MRTTIQTSAISFIAILLMHPYQAFGDESVYKCVINGKTRYMAMPPASDSQCQETLIRDDGPSPEELAKLQEEKKRRQEEEAKAHEAELKEREVRAKELEAAAAVRRARAEEQRLQQPTPSVSESMPAVPVYTYPYWGGGIAPPYPHQHPHYPHTPPSPPRQATPPASGGFMQR